MNFDRNGVSSTTAGLALLVIVVIIAAGAYVALAPVRPATTTYYSLTLQAGGATFPNPLIQVWATSFYQYTNNTVQINYQAIGSGAGQTGILQGTFEFAGSDAPISPAKAANYTAVKGPLLTFPETLGGVAIFYNIPGVKVTLNLTGPVVAAIYLGKITTWNDSAIQALNPKVNLPGNAIVPIHRSDGSGTTYALTNYFSKVSADWNASTASPHYGTSVSWPSSEIGAKGSAGVAAYVQQNPNTIGYADSYYAFANNLKAAAIQNQAGQFLVPSLSSISAAAGAFAPQLQANPTFTITNAPGTGSYPIATFTYFLVWKNQADQQQGYDAAQFLWWAIHQGQAYGPNLYYPALPPNVVAIDEGIIKQMNFKGVPFISG